MIAGLLYLDTDVRDFVGIFSVMLRPKFWPQSQRFGLCLGLGLGVEALASASASNIWPRPGLDLVVLLCNRAFFGQKHVKFGNFVYCFR